MSEIETKLPVGQPRLVRPLFEAADASNEESYYTLGIWLTLAEAVAAISSCDDPHKLGSDGDIEELCCVEIRERNIGWSGLGEVVWKMTWRYDYDFEDDKVKWMKDFPSLQNAKTEGPAA